MNHKEHLGWKRKQAELAESIRLLEQECQCTQSCLREIARTAPADELTAALQKKDQRYFSRIAQQQQAKLRSLQEQAAAVQQNIGRLEQEKRRSSTFFGGMVIIMIVALGLLGYLALQDGALLEGAPPTSLAVSLTPEELQLMGLEERGLEDLDLTTLDLTTIPTAPALKIQKAKTNRELIKDRHIAVEVNKVKSITPDGFASEDIEFTDGRRMLNIHQPFINGKSLGEALPLTAKDGFTYSALFEGTAVDIEFESPEIQADAAGRQFAQSYSAGNRELKIRYDYVLPALNFTPRIRVSSSSAIEVTDPAVGELHAGRFIVDFLAEQQNGYSINTLQVNPNIVYVFLSRNYTDAGIASGEGVILDPTLTISGATTELCGDVTAYDIIDINTNGVLEICEANATSNFGWVNISLGYFGNFSLDSSSGIFGTGFGENGGRGNATSGGRGYQGDNGNNGTIGGATANTPNGGGGGGGTKVAVSDSAAGSGGGFGGGGGAGGLSASGTKGVGGLTYGSPNATALKMGSGGAGGAGDAARAGGDGGAGIKIVTGAGGWVGLRGTIGVSGNNGTNAVAGTADSGGGGGGSGGHVVVIAGTLNMASGIISADGGGGGLGTGTDSCPGGGGGGGRIYLIYNTLQSNLTRWTTNHGFLGGNITSDAVCNNPSDSLGPAHGANGTRQMNSTPFDRMPIPYLRAPANLTTNTTDSTPNFYFNVTDDMFRLGFLNCTVYVANATYPVTTPFPLAANHTVFNDTRTVLTANSSLNNGPYTWWLNCSDSANQFGYGNDNAGWWNYNISETRNMTINIAVEEVSVLKDLLSVDVINASQGTSSQGGGFVVSSTSGRLTNGTSLTYADFAPSGLSRLNLSSIININMSLIANGTHGGYVNFTFGWILAKSNGSTMLNTTLYNSTINQTRWNYSFNTNLLPDGIYNISVHVQNVSTDAAFSPNIVVNYSRGFDIAIDRTPPPVTFWANFSNFTSNNYTSAKLEFNVTSNDTTTYTQSVQLSFLNGNATGTNVTAGRGNASTFVAQVDTAFLSEATYTVQVFANDSLGNSNNSVSNITFRVDRTPPPVTAWMNYTNYINLTSAKIELNVTSNDTTTYTQEVRFGFNNTNATGFNVTATRNASAFVGVIDTALMTEAIYTVIVHANDSLGNRNGTTVNLTLGVDRTPPAVSTAFMNTSNATSYEQGTQTVIVINATFNDSVTTVVDVIFGIFNSGNNTEFNVTPSKLGSYWYTNLALGTLSAGDYTIRLYGNDTVGNFNGSVSNLSFSLTVSASAPVVSWVAPVSTQSITEGSVTNVKFTFNVTDANGAGDINNNSARLYLNFSSEAVRFNDTCQANQSVGNTVLFDCIVPIWYFDGAGDWTINASANDSTGALAINVSANFTLASTIAMTMSPTALTWSTLELGAGNQTSNSDPLTINNTGNRDISTGGITVTGYNLQGVTTTTEFILAQNFSVWHNNGSNSCTGVSCLECNGTQLLNATAETLPYANITAGNNSQNYQNETSGQENLFICLRLVPTEISRQTYNTAGINTAFWTVTVS